MHRAVSSTSPHGRALRPQPQPSLPEPNPHPATATALLPSFFYHLGTALPAHRLRAHRSLPPAICHLPGRVSLQPGEGPVRVADAAQQMLYAASFRTSPTIGLDVGPDAIERKSSIPLKVLSPPRHGVPPMFSPQTPKRPVTPPMSRAKPHSPPGLLDADGSHGYLVITRRQASSSRSPSPSCIRSRALGDLRRVKEDRLFTAVREGRHGHFAVRQRRVEPDQAAFAVASRADTISLPRRATSRPQHSSFPRPTARASSSSAVGAPARLQASAPAARVHGGALSPPYVLPEGADHVYAMARPRVRRSSRSLQPPPRRARTRSWSFQRAACTSCSVLRHRSHCRAARRSAHQRRVRQITHRGIAWPSLRHCSASMLGSQPPAAASAPIMTKSGPVRRRFKPTDYVAARPLLPTSRLPLHARHCRARRHRHQAMAVDRGSGSSTPRRGPRHGRCSTQSCSTLRPWRQLVADDTAQRVSASRPPAAGDGTARARGPRRWRRHGPEGAQLLQYRMMDDGTAAEP